MYYKDLFFNISCISIMILIYVARLTDVKHALKPHHGNKLFKWSFRIQKANKEKEKMYTSS
jgi:hypothetical protein